MHSLASSALFAALAVESPCASSRTAAEKAAGVEVAPLAPIAASPCMADGSSAG